MIWTNNYKKFIATGDLGLCPHCQKNELDYTSQKITSAGLGFMFVWCNNCKKNHVFSRIKVTDNMKKDNVVPNNLI